MKKFLTTLLLFFSITVFGQISVSNGWVASDGIGQADYGKGLFFYNIYRSHSTDANGYFTYQIAFMSNSFYHLNQYDGTAYRTQTIINNAYVLVYGKSIINELFGDYMFWIVFYGDINTGVGDVGVIFRSRDPNLRLGTIQLNYATPKPY